MAGYKVHRYHDISCGHRVYGHEGKCRNLHGHNYRIHFTCVAEDGTLDGVGRVIDFSQIKTRLCMWIEEHWDHRFLVWEEDPMKSYLLELDPTVVVVPFNPTAENIAQYLVEVVGPAQLAGTGIKLSEVVVEETRKCFASYGV
jgi:6-pyruvoyltetrahydropterin/6-carboxytetrahydropterin synthase